jgi:hypothetical protein
MAKDYADQLIMESRNNVHHNANYTRKCRCWGKCFDKYKEKAKGMGTRKFKRLYGAKELSEASKDYPSPNQKICDSCSNFNLGCYHEKSCPQKCKGGIITEVYYGPWKKFSVRENGMWTTIKCPVCGYSERWAAGDGNERF